jgi:thiol-disulfide isomerase/thioredoxin
MLFGKGSGSMVKSTRESGIRLAGLTRPRLTRRGLAAAAATLAMAAVARKSWAQEAKGFAEAMLAEGPRPVPPIGFTDAAGNARTLADYAGQGVILNLWATWCVPCVAEMPALDQLAGQLGAGWAVLPLSSDRQGASVVEAFYRAHNIAHLPVMLDPRGAASRLIGVRGIPTTLVIDRTGQERARLEGAVAWAEPASLAALRGLVA